MQYSMALHRFNNILLKKNLHISCSASSYDTTLDKRVTIHAIVILDSSLQPLHLEGGSSCN
jgi:hypothetical protein